MAGLLDELMSGLNSDQGLLGLAMLSAAAPKERRATIGEGLLSGMSLVNQRRLQREEQAMREKEMRMREQDFGLRQRMSGLQEQQILQAIAAQKQQQEEAARQKEQAQALQQMMLRDLSPVSGIEANAQSGVTGPRPEALSVVGQKRPIDWQKYIALGVPPERIKAMAEAPNLGRAEVARTIEVMGQNGPETVQFDKFGNRVGAGLQKPVELGMQDLGGAVVPWNKYTGAQAGPGLNKSNSPDALLSASTARRGQDLVDLRSREKNAIDKEAVGKVEWKQDVNGAWVGLPKEITGQGPVTPVTTTSPGKREQQAKNALDIIAEAEKLIDKGTGSYIGAGLDQVARAFGGAPAGAVAGGQLKALEGALMMAQPRMEGPQSNMDVALYRQMAAQIGDPTVPPKIKREALSTIKQLHQRYAGVQTEQPATSVEDLLKKYGN